ncbi:MAG: hypothetical protein KC503_23430 [Myxococcales bacterium]|nr:hypothetical protein [Myxococcales bacterium]
MIARAAAFAALLVLATVGCSDSSSPADSAADTTPRDASTEQTTPDASPDAAVCTARYTERVTGSVVDENGKGIANARPQLCLRLANTALVCLDPPFTDAEGKFEINVPESTRCIAEAVMRALVPSTANATTYCPVSLPSDASPDVALASPFTVFATKPATTLPPEGDVAQARVVRFDDGLEIDVIPKDTFLAAPGYAGLAARRLAPDAPGVCFLDAAQRAKVSALYAFSPEGNLLDGGFTARIPNGTNLPANSDVALYLLGGLDCILEDGTLVGEGQWVNYGSGKVSADGATVEAKIPCLTWFGYGPK